MHNEPSRFDRALALAFASAILLLSACSESEAPDDKLGAIHAPETAEVVSAGEALAGAQIPRLDPATMNGAEVRKLIGPGPHCAFQYTSDGKPVLAVKWLERGSGAEAVVKLNGSLVSLSGDSTDNRLILSAEEIRLSVTSDGPLALEPPADSKQQEAEMTFEVTDELQVGYRGYYACHRATAVASPAPTQQN